MESIKSGTVRDDGMVFLRIRGQGKWLTPEECAKVRAARKASHVKYVKSRPDVKAACARRYNLRNKEKNQAYCKAYGSRHAARLLSQRKAWRAKNPEKCLAYQRAYAAKNREKISERQRVWRAQGGILRRLATNVRNRISEILGTKKSRGSLEYIGCTRDELSLHLEALFVDGMSWENYGQYGWHVDHIIPLASADSLETLLPLLHYTNLQPLWAKDNLSKGCRIL